MELQQLQYFIEIAESKSFTKAAGKLFISQPALSKSLHRLEEELDAPLMIRDGKGATLTEAGEILYQRAKAIMACVDSIPSEIREHQDEHHAAIRIKTRALGGLLPSIISEFQEHYPKATFDIRSGGELSIQETDFDFVILPSYEHIEARNSMHLVRERINLVVQKEHPLAEKRGFDFQDLRDLPLVLPSKNLFFYEMVHRWLAEGDIGPIIRAECDDVNACIDLVRSGAGGTLIPEFSVRPRNLSGVCLLYSPDKPLVRNVTLCWNESGYMSNDSKLFKKFLTRSIHDNYFDEKF